MFSFGKKYGKPKLFATLYRLDLRINGDQMEMFINQWNPYKEKLFFVEKRPVTMWHLNQMRPSIKKAMINQNSTWVKDGTLDKMSDIYGWTHQKHFLGCEKCNEFRYIPLMTTYTGCPVCNKKDDGNYTYFEAEEKGKWTFRP